MKQVCQGLAAVVLLVAAGLSFQVHAQFGPMQGPVSPYININRFGASPAVNYFNIVQPQLQFNAAIDQLSMQQGSLGSAMNAVTNTNMMTTGHPAMFGNYLWFYSSRGIGGMGGMGGMGMGGMGMGGMGMGGMGMGGMGMGGMGMGGMGMGGMGMGGMGMGMGGMGMGMGGMGMGGTGMGGMGMGMGGMGMGMGGMGMGMGGMGMGGMGMGGMGMGYGGR